MGHHMGRTRLPRELKVLARHHGRIKTQSHLHRISSNWAAFRCVATIIGSRAEYRKPQMPHHLDCDIFLRDNETSPRPSLLYSAVVSLSGVVSLCRRLPRWMLRIAIAIVPSANASPIWCRG